MNRITQATQARYMIAIVKGDERYVFIYDDDRRVDLLRTFSRFACNPLLSFTWYDAAVCSLKLIKQATEASQ